MMESVEVEGISGLDEVLLSRHSTRDFLDDIPSDEQIKAVISAGYLAPYAGLSGLPKEEIRRFIVLRNGTEGMSTAKGLILSQIRRNSKKLRFASIFVPRIRNQGGAFVKRIKDLSKTGIPSMEVAPFYVVVAERKGFPPVERQSLAHVMENMWLKATSLGLGFQLISATGMMSKDQEFMRLLGLDVGEYELDGCLLGFSQNRTQKVEMPDLDQLVRWL